MRTRKNRKSLTGAQKAAQKKNIFLFLSILAVVAVSGCIIPGVDISSMFPQFRPATTEASSDLITTQNLNVIPNPPISAENAFTVSFEVKNNDENEDVENVNIQRYDSGKCNFVGEGAAPSTGGGVSRTSSSSVEKITDTNVFQFKVTCSGSNSEGDLYVDEKMSGKTTVCGKEREYSIRDLGATQTTDSNGVNYNVYKMRLKVDKHDIDIPYREDKHGIIAGYNCLVTPAENVCVGEWDSVKYRVFDKKSTSRTNCIGSTNTNDVTQCTAKNGCAGFCSKLNTDCESKCNSNNAYTSIEKDSCINRCKANKYVVRKDIDTTCFTSFGYGIPSDPALQPEKNYVGYEGQCCTCGFSDTQKIGTRTTGTVSGEGVTYMPLQTELNEWQFTAPTNDNLGNMPGTCGIKYKITYDFTAKTQASVDVINADTLSRMQRAGQTPTANPTQSVGVGPIKVFFDFGASQPVRSGDILPIFVTVEDRGTGLLDRGDVAAGNLRLTIPSEFDEVSCSKFSNSGGEWENSAAVPMIKKKSPQLRCSFKMPDVTDIKTFYIEARLDYTYKLDNEIKVSVNPTLVK